MRALNWGLRFRRCFSVYFPDLLPEVHDREYTDANRHAQGNHLERTMDDLQHAGRKNEPGNKSNGAAGDVWKLVEKIGEHIVKKNFEVLYHK